jgi:hypothetical protein
VSSIRRVGRLTLASSDYLPFAGRADKMEALVCYPLKGHAWECGSGSDLLGHPEAIRGATAEPSTAEFFRGFTRVSALALSLRFSECESASHHDSAAG